MTAFDAKTRFGELLRRVEAGEEVAITRHGTVVARVLPARVERSVDERRQAIAAWRETRKGVTLGADLSIRDLVNEGRRS